MCFLTEKEDCLNNSFVRDKRAKYKTELCANGASCKYGKKCWYAHGEDELRATSFGDLEDRDMGVQVHNYRTRPCFTFISTGSW